jgi:hypothetical protein
VPPQKLEIFLKMVKRMKILLMGGLELYFIP